LAIRAVELAGALRDECVNICRDHVAIVTHEAQIGPQSSF